MKINPDIQEKISNKMKDLSLEDLDTVRRNAKNEWVLSESERIMATKILNTARDIRDILYIDAVLED